MADARADFGGVEAGSDDVLHIVAALVDEVAMSTLRGGPAVGGGEMTSSGCMQMQMQGQERQRALRAMYNPDAEEFVPRGAVKRLNPEAQEFIPAALRSGAYVTGVNNGPTLNADAPEFFPAASRLTTLMIRNIPNALKKLHLVALLDEFCSRSPNINAAYDFLHLVMDIETNVNKSYAFVNFTSPEAAQAFRREFDGNYDWKACRSRGPRRPADYAPTVFSPPRNGCNSTMAWNIREDRNYAHSPAYSNTSFDEFILDVTADSFGHITPTDMNSILTYLTDQ
ncbi:hypothetical protein L7F22_003508 [Adiantum nelumboides]|nr:hypothetical protein [Adiantum nelumboides]